MFLKPPSPTRRQILRAGGGFARVVTAGPAFPDRDAKIRAREEFGGGAKVQLGKVKIDIPPLVENGNSVPVTLRVDNPVTPENYVKSIALFVEKNPQPHAGVYHFGPRSARAIVSTRLRLATSQTLVAVARLSDGTLWFAAADVIVTLAACTEE